MAGMLEIKQVTSKKKETEKIINTKADLKPF